MNKVKLIVACVILQFFACNKYERITGVKTVEVKNTSYNSTLAIGRIEDLSDNQHSEHGFCYSENPKPTMDDQVFNMGTINKIGNYETTIANLKPETDYYISAFVKEGDKYIIDKPISFRTAAPKLPIIRIIEASNVSYFSAIFGGKLISGNGDSVTISGVCWGLTENPTINDNKIQNPDGSREFQLAISNLKHNTKYYGRAWATNNLGTGYSQNTEFTTLPYAVPTVTTNENMNLTDRSVSCLGTIHAQGDGPVISTGVYYGLTPDLVPGVCDSVTGGPVADGYQFWYHIYNLQANTKYYYRIFARNLGGVGYGEVKSFTTLNTVEIPVISLTSIEDYYGLNIKADGKVISTGGVERITDICLLYSQTNPNPEFDPFKYIWGSPTITDITFNFSKNGFTVNTKYYFRMWARNLAGEAYSNVIEFTIPPLIPPIISTEKVYQILSTSAHVIGKEEPYYNFQGNGDHGICWNTSGNPQLNDGISQHVINPPSNLFEGIITGLEPSTTYYARVWATSTNGTSYGDVISFTTLASSDVVKDFEGNEYSMVTIGNQIWLGQNLKSTKYRNGASINGYYAYSSNENNAKIFGYLYPKDAAIGSEDMDACPTGWHVPTKVEWETMTTFLGGNGVAGNKLKEAGNYHWYGDNYGTNSSNFTAIGAGAHFNNVLEGRNLTARFWTKTISSGSFHWSTQLRNGMMSILFESNGSTSDAMAVRCIKNSK
jgi:uncharacterized protein (TIGR02145 family)